MLQLKYVDWWHVELHNIAKSSSTIEMHWPYTLTSIISCIPSFKLNFQFNFEFSNKIIVFGNTFLCNVRKSQ